MVRFSFGLDTERKLVMNWTEGYTEPFIGLWLHSKYFAFYQAIHVLNSLTFAAPICTRNAK